MFTCFTSMATDPNRETVSQLCISRTGTEGHPEVKGLKASLCTVDDILLFDEVFMKRLQEVRFHDEAPAVGLNATALRLQLFQQGAPPPLP